MMNQTSECELQESLNATLPSPNDPSTAIIESANETVSNGQNGGNAKMDISPDQAVLSKRREDVEVSSNSDGKREESLPLAGFDILRFKNSFLEVIEESRLQRTIKLENEKHIEQLLMDKHELTHKLDEAVSLSKALMESHDCKLQEMTKKHEEELQQFKNEQAKGSILQESCDKELKSLKDELRTLHLAKHVLEKTVHEQERQLQLQSSSRESYLTKMAQLEEKCSTLFKMAENASENITTLETNVKQAKELHCKLEYANSHQNCELKQLQQKLESCRHELIESRAQRLEADSKGEDKTEVTAKYKATEHDLKMQVELCRHLQSQLSSLREEHQGLLNQLKEAHTLLERHVENATRANDKEEELKKKLSDLSSEIEDLQERLSVSEDANKTTKEKHTFEMEISDKKILDTEQRLNTLQADYKLLQDSYDQLETSKVAMKREHEVEVGDLRVTNAEMEQTITRMKEASREFESMECASKDKLDKLQSALDQSEVELMKCEDRLKEKDRTVSELKRKEEEHKVCARLSSSTVHFSPEVITQTLAGDETPDLIVQQTPKAPSPPNSSAEAAKEEVSPQVPACNEHEDLEPPHTKKRKVEKESVVEDESALPATSTASEEKDDTELIRNEDPVNSDLEEEGVGVTTGKDKDPEVEGGVADTGKEKGGVADAMEEKGGVADTGKDEGGVIDTGGEEKGGVAGTGEEKGGVAGTGKEETVAKDENMKSGLKEYCKPEDNEHVKPEAEGGETNSLSDIAELEGGASLQFSPEGVGEERMLNTQMNRQIERVETFLKMDRLRRQKQKK